MTNGSATLPRSDLDKFVSDLCRHGSYVLPSGGGVIPEPRRAIDAMGTDMGRLDWSILR